MVPLFIKYVIGLCLDFPLCLFQFDCHNYNVNKFNGTNSLVPPNVTNIPDFTSTKSMPCLFPPVSIQL